MRSVSWFLRTVQMTPVAPVAFGVMILAAASILSLVSSVASAQNVVTFTVIPRNMQLIPRDESGAGELRIAGTVAGGEHDSVRLDLYRNGAFWRTVGARLIYENRTAPFDLLTRIPAELAEFDVRFCLDGVVTAVRTQIVCGDVYLINGQSNAQTTGGYAYQNEFIRSFGSSRNDPEALADSSWGTAQAQTIFTRCAVGTWGIEMGKILVERYGVPVALLNGAVGGTGISAHLRHEGDSMDPTTIYGRLLWRAAKAGLRDGIKAILWHQGESDTDANWSFYAERFQALRDAWQEDFAPQRVYVFQIHQGCGWDFQSQIREIQRELPERFDNVEVMSTIGVGLHDGCHYGIDGYRQMGRWISGLVERDFYGEPDTLYVRPPNVQRIWFSSPARDELRVRFDQPVTWPPDTLGIALEDYIYLDGSPGAVSDGRPDETDPRTLVLTLDGPSGASRVTYLPNEYDDLGRVYEGPLVRGPRGIGALSFFEFPIMDPADVPDDRDGAGRRIAAAAPPGVAVVPNPFTDRAEVRFTLPRSEAVRVELLDAGGRVVRILADAGMPAGTHSVPLRSRGEGTDRLSPGLFFVRCRTATGAPVHVKATLLR